MLNFIEQVILILISIILTFLLTKHQYKKDSLREYKINACKNLWESIIDFSQESYPRNNIENIFEAYCKFQSSFYKSYAFLPRSLSLKIQSLDNTICYKLKTSNILKNCLDEFHRDDQSQHTRESVLRNPNINSLFLDIFSSLTKEIPNISEEIKKAFGTISPKSKK